MGHYDGMEERIREQRDANDLIIRPLTPEQFVAAHLQKEIDHEKWVWEQTVKRISYLEAKLEKLGIVPNQEAVKVLSRYARDYEYKLTHDPKVKKVLRGEE